MRTSFLSYAAAMLVAGLSGCGDKAPAKANLADATSAKTVEAVKQQAVQANLPKANRDTPLENFVEYNSGNQLMFAYLSLNAIPIDYKEVLNRYSQDYADLQSKDKVKFYKTPDSVLQKQLEIYDEVVAKKSAENPLFKEISESQQAFARRATQWEQDTVVNRRMAYNHYFGANAKKKT